MNNKNQIPAIIEIPKTELKELDKLIKSYRKKHIRNSQETVDKVFEQNSTLLPKIKKGNVSNSNEKTQRQRPSSTECRGL